MSSSFLAVKSLPFSIRPVAIVTCVMLATSQSQFPISLPIPLTFRDALDAQFSAGHASMQPTAQLA